MPVADRLWARTVSAVERSSSARLDRIGGSRPAQWLALSAIARRYDPDTGFVGEVQLDLARASGRVRAWTFEADGTRAVLRRGASSDPSVRISTSVADAMRIAAGGLSAGRALLEGRIELQGSWRTAMRLGSIFGA